VEQPTTLLKYVRVDISEIKTTNKKFEYLKKKYLASYDLQ
jgi:hypothetical protein